MEGYEEKHHGLRLVEVADGYQFRTKATYSRYVQDLFKVNALVLTPSALEVLAIIAYRQPVSKVEVDRIRGVDSGHIVRVLMDKRLVKVVGRSDEVGRPVLYGTTPEFLEVFNLPNIDQLPPESELEALATDKKKEISEIKSIVAEGDKARFVFDEIEELDQLSESIKAISADTEFTKTIKGNDEEKSAFDILEEFLGKEVTTKFNQEAVESELVNSAFDPKVISDLTAGPFNLPEEEEEFEMIDLDTGEPIEADAIAEFNELFGDSDDEEIELDKALDDAFEKLTGEKLEALDELVEEVEETAKDLDLDLSFLKGESNQNSELDEPTDLQ
jgi:segregation and condensation protein B